MTVLCSFLLRAESIKQLHVVLSNRPRRLIYKVGPPLCATAVVPYKKPLPHPRAFVSLVPDERGEILIYTIDVREHNAMRDTTFLLLLLAESYRGSIAKRR